MIETAVFGLASVEREPLSMADYGLLADRSAAALVGRDGSIDWLCLPRYDSPAIFDRILDPRGGHWSISPAAGFASEQRYFPGTLVLQTTFTTDAGVVRLTDAMLFAHDAGSPHEVLRGVEGISGEVDLVMELASRSEDPTRVAVRAGVPVELDTVIRASFAVSAGDRIGFSLCWIPTDARVAPEPTAPTAVAARIKETVWRSWEEGHDVSAGTHRRLAELSSHLVERGETRELVGA